MPWLAGSHYASRAIILTLSRFLAFFSPLLSTLAGLAQQGIIGEGYPGSVVPSDVPEGELWKDKASLIRGVGEPGKLTANCA